MMETHPEHKNVFRDDDMLEYGSDTKYLSPPHGYPSRDENQRVLAAFEKGTWKIEAQVMLDRDWYVASRESLENPPQGHDEWHWSGSRVGQNYGVFSGLSRVGRVLLAPLYALWFAWLCIKGEDVNLQVLED